MTMAARYDVDTEAIDRARKLLGIAGPVRVAIRRFTWGSGRYVALRNGTHHISVASDLSPRAASRTLWHELTHALQVETLGGEVAFTQQWWAEMDALGLSRHDAARARGRRYARAPLERAARANERRHREVRLCSRPIGPCGAR